MTVAKVLCKKNLRWYERLLKRMGVNIVDSHYDLVYSSRSVIKNAYADTVHNNFYNSDVWKIAADKLKDCLLDGISLYGELVGYTPTGSFIQKDFDYNCDVGQLDCYVFRATYTNPTGTVFEFSWQQIKDYCAKYGIKHVPELYYGKAKDLFSLPTDDNWHQNFFKALSDKYLEGDCPICRKKVPFEGIVVTAQKKEYKPLKLKSFAFRYRETKLLDGGHVDIEDIGASN